MKIPNEFKVGALATVAIVFLVLGYNLMRGKNVLSRERVYYAKYDDVAGLAIAGHVRYNGVNVGRVQEIHLTEGGRGKNVVTMNVIPDLEIPRGSVARIVQIDLFGTKAVQIELSNQSGYLESGDTLLSTVGKDVVNDISAKAATLLGSLDSLVENVNSVFDVKTKASLQKSFAHIESTLDNFNKTLASTSDRLDRILANVESITTNLNQNKELVTQILTNINSVTDSLKRAQIAATFQNAHDALEKTDSIMKKINSGEGSLGLLVNDDKLYQNLQESSKSLDELLKDLKSNPGRYVHVSVFGKKQKSEPPPKQ